MEEFKFRGSDVQIILDHTMAAQEHASPFSSQTPVAQGLFFIKDQGVYLMSTGLPFLQDGSKDHPQSFAVYAEHFGPGNCLLEGDQSFVEHLPITLFEEFDSQFDLLIIMTDNQLMVKKTTSGPVD